MARYIDVGKKVEELENKIDSLTRLAENRPYDEAIKRDIGTYESFLIELQNTPTADVVEVVRCKECIYANDYATICHYGVGSYVKPDHYCGYGEKR